MQVKVRYVVKYKYKYKYAGYTFKSHLKSI
jgi:hypothetical protein